MNRPSFRSGLALGVLGGAAAAVLKALQGRRAAASPPVPAPSTDWPPLTPSPVASTAAPPPPPSGPSRPSATRPSTPSEPDPTGPRAGEGGERGPTWDEDDASDRDGAKVPEPEATLPSDRVAGAAPDEVALIASGGTGAIPPAPEPTFGTAPDPTAAADSDVPVATPVASEPEEVLAVPKRAAPKRRSAPVAAAPRALGGRPAKAQPAQVEAAPAPTKKAAPRRAATKKVAAPAPWVVPAGSACPGSHPIKAKLSSRIFHLPGMFAYERTTPDRCYVDAAAAEADGLRSAKR